jgi:hypothetical protein
MSYHGTQEPANETPTKLPRKGLQMLHGRLTVTVPEMRFGLPVMTTGKRRSLLNANFERFTLGKKREGGTRSFLAGQEILASSE